MTDKIPSAPAGAPAAVVTVPGAGLPDIGAMAPENVQALLETIVQNPRSNLALALTDKNHPEHRAARSWQDAAYARAYTKSAAELADERLAAVPEKPDGYTIELPGIIARDAAFETEARGLFHAAGLNQVEVSSIGYAWANLLKNPPADAERDRAGAELGLRAIWRAPGEFEANVARARKVLNGAKVSDRVREMLEISGFGNNPQLIKALADAGRRRGQ